MSKKLFDFCIGNPPFNEDFDNSGNNKNYGKPLYNKFMDGCFPIADKVELIHPAKFLFNAGGTTKEWNQIRLNDPHYKVLKYEADSSSVFQNVSIPGGVAITYRDSSNKIGPISVFTKYAELNSILAKIHIDDESKSMLKIIYIQNDFNLEELYKEHPDCKAVIGGNGRDARFEKNIFEKTNVFTEKPIEDSIKVLGIYNRKRTWRYLPLRFVDMNHKNINKFKVIVSSADGAAGTIGNPVPARIIGHPIIESPYEGYTRSFIGIGAFNTLEEAESAQKYVKSRFLRATVGILKATQMANKPVWRYAPIQNFTSESDIDWSQSIHDIDLQLYRKYDLSDDEINFIETHVKEMD